MLLLLFYGDSSFPKRIISFFRKSMYNHVRKYNMKLEAVEAAEVIWKNRGTLMKRKEGVFLEVDGT